MRFLKDLFKPNLVIGTPPYMKRWYIIPRNKWFNIYLHHILKSDDDRALHDHPFNSVSIMLQGWMIEHYKDGETVKTREIRAGRIVYRKGEFAHRLEVPKGSSGAWTVFITGHRFRQWGFHCGPDTPAGGWRHWQLFTHPSDRGKVGIGCGELE